MFTRTLALVLSVAFAQQPDADRAAMKAAAEKVVRYVEAGRAVPVYHPHVIRLKAKVGDRFRIKGDSTFRVVSVLSPTEFVANFLDMYLLFRGVPTKGLTDDKPVSVDEAFIFEAKSTEKRLGRTMLALSVIELEGKPTDGEIKLAQAFAEKASRAATEKAAREAAAKAAADAAAKAEQARQQAETAATAKVSLARQYIDLGKKDLARAKLRETLRDYPETKAAEEAKALLKKL